jgi:hypothetical protein
MSTERDTTRIVRSWLEEGRTTLPDWVRDDVMDRLPSTPQRRSRGTARRFLTMPTAAKTAIAAAAVILVAVGAFALLPRESGPGAPGPTPTTAPTTNPTAEPSAAISFVPPSGRIDPGTYRMGEDASIVLTIPEGWFARNESTDRRGPSESSYPTGTDIRKHREGLGVDGPEAPDLSQPGEQQIWVDASDLIRAYPDACDSSTEILPEPAGPTVDDLVSALRAQEGSDTSEPVNVTVGGRQVQRFEITSDEAIDVSTCQDGTARVWYSDAYGFMHAPATVYMVQTDAGRIVFGFGHADDTSAADIAELDAIVDSMVIEP